MVVQATRAFQQNRSYADTTDGAPTPGFYAPATSDGWWLLPPPLPSGRQELVVEARPSAAVLARGRHDQQFSVVMDVGGVPGDDAADEDAMPEWKPDAITL